MPKRRYKRLPVCKPCWELKYCPYGDLVETMPTLPNDEDLQKIRKVEPTYDPFDFEASYKRLLEHVPSIKAGDEDAIWRTLYAILYCYPPKIEILRQYDPKDIECTMRDGHSCPVFFHYSESTETREGRRAGRYIPREIMFKVVRRDDYKCQLCGNQVPDNEIEFDHVIPVAKGGPTSVENIRLLCRECNRQKGDSMDEFVYPLRWYDQDE